MKYFSMLFIDQGTQFDLNIFALHDLLFLRSERLNINIDQNQPIPLVYFGPFTIVQCVYPRSHALSYATFVYYTQTLFM